MTDPRPPAPAEGAAPPARRPLPLRHYLWGVGAALIVFFALRWLNSVITPFLIGAILAYLGTPLVDAAQRRRVPRSLATTIVVLLFGLIDHRHFLRPDSAGAKRGGAGRQAAARVVRRGIGAIGAMAAAALRHRGGAGLSSRSSRCVTQNAESAHELSMRLLSGVKTGGRIALSILINLALIPVVMFYLLRDWKMIGQRLQELVPRDWQAKFRTIVREIDDGARRVPARAVLGDGGAGRSTTPSA